MSSVRWIVRRGVASRRLRVAVVMLLALVPLSLVAQQGASRTATSARARPSPFPSRDPAGRTRS